jgi:2-hydroxychromene-2-carboxylate isomerase
MAKQVEFFFDYGSPFSYLADTQLPALAERTGATIVYRPMLLGAVFKETGNASPISVPAKARYMSGELERWARRYRVPLQSNPNFPLNTLRLMRGAVAALQDGTFPRYHSAVFAAFWSRGLNLGDESVVREVLQEAGLDASRALARIDEPEIKAQLKANTDEAVRRGVFGAPSFFVGEELFWGNDRLPFVEEALKLWS